MPSTVWSGPVPPLGIVSSTPAVAAAITDLSPQQTVIWPGMVQASSRVYLYACGNYITTGTTTTIIWGFYMNAQGTALSSSPAILAASAATAIVSTTSVAWPWQMWYRGVIRTMSTLAGTGAVIVGQGRLATPTSLTAFAADVPIPVTAALRTVTGTATALNTNIPQTVSVAITPSATTNITSVTCDEHTCELIG